MGSYTSYGAQRPSYKSYQGVRSSPLGATPQSMFQPSKQGFTSWQANANQQKAMAASGKPNPYMQGAMQFYGGMTPELQSVQKVFQDSWANYNPSYEQYVKEGRQGASLADDFNKRNAALRAQKNQQNKKKQESGKGGKGGVDYNGQSTVRPPSKIADALTEDAAQNVLAQGYQAGDTRYQTKGLARPGFSQGKGQEFAGARKATEQLNQFAGQAADIRNQDQLMNHKMNADYQKAREMEAQQNAMMQHSIGQSNWAKNFAQQSIQAQNQMAYLQGILGLQMALLR